MKNRKPFGFVAAGLIAGLVLGSIGIAGAATVASKSTTASADSTASGQPSGRGFDGPGGPGGHGGHGRDGAPRGGGVLGEALAALTKTDVQTIMTKRAAGTSFAAQAKSAGVSNDALIAKATALVKADLDAAVKAGTMTSAQRTAELKTLKAHLTEELTETHAIGGPGGHGGRDGHGAMRGGGVLGEALAALTKTDVQTIMTKRAAGTSFAAQAKSAGVSNDALIAKATALVKADLDAAVKAGTMTSAQRTAELKTLKAHLTEELTETHAIGGPGGRGPGAPDSSPNGSTGSGTTTPSDSSTTSDSTTSL